jgi:hypothetical protein
LALFPPHSVAARSDTASTGWLNFLEILFSNTPELQLTTASSASSSSFSAPQPCRSALLIRVPWAELTQQQQKRNPLYLLLVS